jgi:hypothetical protein
MTNDHPFEGNISMSLDATYHRTFLPDGPIESACRQSCHGDPKPASRWDQFEPPQFDRKSPASYELKPLHPDPPPFQTADMRDRGKPYYRSQRRRPAFMLNNGQLRPIHIVDKIDQQFAKVATPWEHEFSELTKDGSGRFSPLVNPDYLVVGHVGAIKGDEMIIVKGAPIEWSGTYGGLGRDLEADESIYVSRTVPEGWTKYDTKYPMSIYTVVTGIDGEVISGDITDSMPGAIATESPIEYITLTAAILKLGTAIVRGLIKSIIRKRLTSYAVKEISGPTRKVLERVLAKRAAAKAANAAKNTYNPIAGITQKHHRAFIEAADESQLIIVVRHTNPKSIPLIEKGCPGKPKNLEFINTSPTSGIVMANTSQEVLRARKLGYYVVEEGKTARRLVMRNGKEVAEDMPVQSPFWQLEKGQVLDPATKKPIVGDYDLMGVIDPKAPGRNLGLVAQNGEALTDVTNPLVQKASAAINKRLDIPRVLHGPQDMYKGFRKGASAFQPDGMVKHFETEDAVKAFYDSMKRQPRAGQYPRPSPDTSVRDELAARRGR